MLPLKAAIARMLVLCVAVILVTACSGPGTGTPAGQNVSLNFISAKAATDGESPTVNETRVPRNVVLAPGTSSTVDLDAVYDNPTPGGFLSFTVSSTDPNVVVASISGCDLVLGGVAPGVATITVSASTSPESGCPDQTRTGGSSSGGTSSGGSTSGGTASSGGTSGGSTSGGSSSGGSSSGGSSSGGESSGGSSSGTSSGGTSSGSTSSGGTSSGGSSSGGTSNPPPVVAHPLASQSLTKSSAPVTVDLATVFSDPDGGPLTYSVSSSDPAVATATVGGGVLTITAISQGNATITVVATDSQGASALNTAVVTVDNQPPALSRPIPDQTVTTTYAPTRVNLAGTFTDPDGDPLTYSASTDAPGIAIAHASGHTLTIIAQTAGSTILTVKVSDGHGGTAQTTATITVDQGHNHAPEASGSFSDLTLGTAAPPATDDDLPGHFTDPDGDPLSFSASSSDTGVATTAVSGHTLTVTPVAPGTATVTVIATDIRGVSARQTFTVTVFASVLRYFSRPDAHTLFSFNLGIGTVSVDTDFEPAVDPVVVYQTAPGGAQPQFVVYVRASDKTFARVAAQPTVPPPVPQTVSSFNMGVASPICSANIGADQADASNAPIVVAVPSGPTLCAPDAPLSYSLIRAGDDAAALPVSFPPPDSIGSHYPTIVQLLNPGTAAAAGWLIRQDNELTRVSADASSVTTVMSGGSPVPISGSFSGSGSFNSLGTVGNGVLMLNIDNELWAYDEATNAITDLDYPFVDTESGTVLADPVHASRRGREFYFVDDNALWRTQGGGLGTPVEIGVNTQPTPDGPRAGIALGTTRVAWTYIDSNGTGDPSDDTELLRSVSATAPGTGITLDSGNVSGSEIFDTELAAAGGRLYYNKYVLSGTAENADSAVLDGSTAPTSTVNARWLFPVETDGGQPLTVLYRVDGLTGADDTPANKPLVAVPLDDPSSAVAVGTLPDDAQSVDVEPMLDNRGLATIYTGSGDDIIYVDAAVPGSLQRLTATPSEDENPVPEPPPLPPLPTS